MQVADRQEPIFFSVVTAVRNGEKFIAETLEAILAQTYRDFELLIVDDGSTDRTVDIVNQYMKQDNYLRLVNNSNDPGLSQALNCGVSHAKGNWIARCDADDLWKPEKLQIQADFIYSWQQAEPIVLLSTSGYTINDASRIIGPFPSYPNTFEEFTKHRASYEPLMMLHSSVVFNKEIFHQIGGYRYDYIGAEDSDLFTRFSDIGVAMNIDQPLTLYRKHLGSFQLENTVKQMNNLDRIQENTNRRRNGMDELSYKEFIEETEQKMSKPEIAIRLRKQKGKYFYRVGAINLANNRLILGFIYLFLTIFYDHRLVLGNLQRIAKFKLSLVLSLVKKWIVGKSQDSSKILQN